MEICRDIFTWLWIFILLSFWIYLNSTIFRLQNSLHIDMNSLWLCFETNWILLLIIKHVVIRQGQLRDSSKTELSFISSWAISLYWGFAQAIYLTKIRDRSLLWSKSYCCTRFSRRIICGCTSVRKQLHHKGWLGISEKFSKVKVFIFEEKFDKSRF